MEQGLRSAPLIRSRPWRCINLFTYLLTYLVALLPSRDVIGHCAELAMISVGSIELLSHTVAEIFCGKQKQIIFPMKMY